MIKYDELLKSIYKYYSVGTGETDFINEKKKMLREKKIMEKEMLREKILADILSLSKDYAAIDWTEPESCCYELKVLLHKKQQILDDDKILIEQLGGIRHDLRIFISVLEPYYYTFIETTGYDKVRNEWKFETTQIYTEEERKYYEKVRECLSKKGYVSLSDTDAAMIVPDVQTELKELGKVNVFDCLFTDMVNID